MPKNLAACGVMQQDLSNRRLVLSQSRCVIRHTHRSVVQSAAKSFAQQWFCGTTNAKKKKKKRKKEKKEKKEKQKIQILCELVI